jgi:hypothetical protein
MTVSERLQNALRALEAAGILITEIHHAGGRLEALANVWTDTQEAR